MESMLNKYDYSGVDQVCYSDPNCESYIKPAQFLGDTVEDWGCGTGWAKKYFKNYRGIDGSPHKYVDEVVDLINYTSDVDNILMRQVLELNPDWRRILENVKKSFRKRFCLVVYSPLSDTTKVFETSPIYKANGLTDVGSLVTMTFNKKDILDYFPESEYKVTEESIKTEQGYGLDWVLYVEKI